MKANKERIIYYNMDGSIDEVSTFINNNEWVMPLVVIICIVITGIVEAL